MGAVGCAVNTEGYFDLAFDRTGERLAVGGYGQPLRILEVGSRRDLPHGEGHERRLRAIDFSATHLITATRSGEVAFWHVRSEAPALVKVLQVDLQGDAIHDVATGSTDQSLALIMERGGLRLWSAPDGEGPVEVAGDTSEAGKEKTARSLPARELDERGGSWRVQTLPSQTWRSARETSIS